MEEFSDGGASIDEIEKPAGSDLNPSVDPHSEGLVGPASTSSQPEVPLGKRILWEKVVSKPASQPTLPSSKRHKVEAAPKELRWSSRFRRGAASLSACLSALEIIELDEEEEEATKMGSEIPRDP